MSVYFAQVGPYIKVGFSDDPVSRTATVTRLGERPADVARGEHAHLIGWVPGDRTCERELHRRFADRWAAGEWFHMDATEIRQVIWDDPRGVDLDRMSALAVFYMHSHPAATRDELAAAGVCVEAPPLDEALRGLFGGVA